MKKCMRFVLIAASMFALLAGPKAWAVDEHAGHDHSEHEQGGEIVASAPAIHPVQREDGIIELNNEVCPVSGKPVSGKHFFEHEGVKYGFCCKMCINDFKKNPEKFALSMDTIHEAMGHTGHTH